MANQNQPHQPVIRGARDKIKEALERSGVAPTKPQSESPPKGPHGNTQGGTPPDEPAVDARWTCSLNQASLDEKPIAPLNKPLTVGEKFILTCEGESVTLVEETLGLSVHKEDQYTVKILRIQQLSENKAVFTATTYKVGENDLQRAIITDGSRKVALDGIKFSVSSVIDPKENPEGKMYAPATPVALAWPLWIWITLAVIGFIVLAWVLRILQLSARRRRFLAELNSHGTHLTPYNQFNKDMRELNRHYPIAKPKDWNETVAGPFIDKLNDCFQWYLAREFAYPTMNRSPRAVLGDLKTKDKRAHKLVAVDLRMALRELRKGLAAREKITALDAQQLMEICRKVVDHVHQVRHGRREVSA